MPLWLTRLCTSIVAAVVLACAASWFVRSGTLQAAVSRLNPWDPSRQLERSLVNARRAGSANVVIVGHTAFINALRQSCNLGDRVVAVPVDQAGRLEYEIAAMQMAALQPSQVIFHARPHLWTNVKSLWKEQKVDLLPSDRHWVRPSRKDIRAFLSALREMVRRPVGNPDAKVSSFLGVLFDKHQSREFMGHIAGALSLIKHKSTATFVMDPEEIPSDALPETRQKILELFDHHTPSPGIELQTAESFADRYGCAKSALKAVTMAMRGTEAQALSHENEEEED